MKRNLVVYASRVSFFIDKSTFVSFQEFFVRNKGDVTEISHQFLVEARAPVVAPRIPSDGGALPPLPPRELRAWDRSLKDCR